MRLSISDVLDAYRADLSNAGRARFSANDATWLAFGTLLQRAVSLPSAEREVYLHDGVVRIAEGFPASALTVAISALARATRAADADASSPDAELCAAAMTVATDAEVAGAFALATLILDFARVLVRLSEFRMQGRLLGQQSRIFRLIGELDAALELCDEIDDIGTTHGDQELIALAHLGKAVVARVRGNYPRAREYFAAILTVAATSDEVRELHMHAHHGLLVVSAIAKDFDAALKHGSLALHIARTEDKRLEMLLNLAAVCYDVGQFRSALHGYLTVLARSPSHRVRIGAFGGAAVASARLGDRAMVDTLGKAAATLLAHEGHPFELADMSREFAEAYWYAGEPALAAHYRESALEQARRGGFFEIVHRLESFPPPPDTNPSHDVVLTDDALTVATQLASGDSEELLLAAVGADQQ